MISISEMKNVKIEDDREFPVVAVSVPAIIEILNWLVNTPITAIDDMEVKDRGIKDRFGAIIIQPPNLSEDQKNVIYMKVVQQVEGDITLKQRLTNSTTSGIIAAIKHLPLGIFLAPIIDNLQQKQKM